ncbi:MAG: hypothetical protein ACLPY1_19655, partial [Terracidiphilus sp.]
MRIPSNLLVLICAVVPAAAYAQFPDWIQQSELPSPGTNDYGFGTAAGSDSLVVIGAAGASANGTYPGAAFTYSKSGSAWIAQAELTGPDGAYGDLFGETVAVSGSIVAIGAPAKKVNGQVEQGAVYIFVQNGGIWTQQAELTAPDGQKYDEFGNYISLDGTTVLVGVGNHDDSTGVVYVFVQSGTTWTLQAELTGPAPGAGFGGAVSLSGDTALIGSPNASGDAGAAYVYARSGTTWTQQAELHRPGGLLSEKFGGAVALSGNIAMVGAPDYQAVDVFSQSVGTWTHQQEFGPTGAGAGSEFGIRIALNGTTAMVGDTTTTVNGQQGEGSVFVFQQSASGYWSQVAALEPPDGVAQDGFGGPVWLDSGTAFVGSLNHNAGLGAMYVFGNIPSPVGNASFEQGNTSSPVSFSGLYDGGTSAATRWEIWNNASGTTTTELCSTTCPSGSTPPTPNQGAYTLHVKTTSAYAGI